MLRQGQKIRVKWTGGKRHSSCRNQVNSLVRKFPSTQRCNIMVEKARRWWRSGTITNWFLDKDLSHLITASFHLIKFDALSPETAFHASLSSSLLSFIQKSQKEGCQWAKLLCRKKLDSSLKFRSPYISKQGATELQSSPGHGLPLNIGITSQDMTGPPLAYCPSIVSM